MAVGSAMRLAAALASTLLVVFAAPGIVQAAELSRASVAASAAGSLVAWAETGDDGASAIRVAVAAPGGRYAEPVTVARFAGGAGIAGTGLSDAGAAVVVWTRSPTEPPKEGGPSRPWVEAALRGSDGAFGPVVALSGTPADPAPRVVVTMSRTGHAGVAWPQDGSTRVALKAPGGALRPAGSVTPDGPVGLGLAADGEGVLGVTCRSLGGCDFAVATRPPEGGFGDAARLGPGKTFENEQAVAIGSRGGVLALHAPEGQARGGLAASRRARGAAEFAPSEPLDGETMNAVAAAVSSEGEAVALWTRTVPAG